MCFLKQRGDLIVCETSDATANPSDQEGKFGMLLRKRYELIHIRTDGLF